MSNTNTPIVNAPNKYVNGLAVFQAGVGLLGINAGAARDSTNTNDIIVPSQLNFLISQVGVNGLDTGVITVNTWYAVYVIGDSTGNSAPAGQFSLSTLGPQLPKGYDIFRRVGWFRTDPSTATFIARSFPYGEGLIRDYYIETPTTFLTAGNATVPTIISATTNSAAPSLSNEILVDIAFTANAATDVAQFVFANSNIPIIRFGTGVAGLQVGSLIIPISSGAFRYWVTSASDSLTLKCTGFKDYLT